MVRESEISFGPVRIIRGPYSGRVGNYDDDDMDERGRYCAIVYLGTILLSGGFFMVPHSHICEADVGSLLKRSDELFRLLGIGASKLPADESLELLHEYRYIQSILWDRMFKAQFKQPKTGLRMFVSHSSKDKEFVRLLAMDLVNAGCRVWFDEWKITAGESIPRKIEQGLSGCDVLVLVMSNLSVSSRWVEEEWQSKYWSEIQTGRVSLIPVLKEKCAIPTLLQHRKYADFSSAYYDGFEELVRALSKVKRSKRTKNSKV